MTEQSAVRYEKDADGIVVLTLDDPTASANTMNELYGRSMEEAVARLESEKDSITGVVITSAKKTFFAGGNLSDLQKVGPDQAKKTSEKAKPAKPSCAASSSSACRRSLRSTAPRSAVAWRSRSPSTTG